MSTTETPYLETFGCHLDDGEDHNHPGDCDWGYACGTCGCPVDDGPCPDHAPLDIPGLMLADCGAVPRHPRTWLIANDAGYGAPCMYCAYDAESAAHAPCAHSHHWPWRHWAVTHKTLHWLVLAGVTRGGWFTHDTHCRGCVDHLRLGGSSYVLGWPKWKWRCLLKGRHWPGVLVFADMCGKCAPCPGCGSVTYEHVGVCTLDGF